MITEILTFVSNHQIELTTASLGWSYLNNGFTTFNHVKSWLKSKLSRSEDRKDQASQPAPPAQRSVSNKTRKRPKRRYRKHKA